MLVAGFRATDAQGPVRLRECDPAGPEKEARRQLDGAE
jgi:hypothetical protein